MVLFFTAQSFIFRVSTGREAPLQNLGMKSFPWLPLVIVPTTFDWDELLSFILLISELVTHVFHAAYFVLMLVIIFKLGRAWGMVGGGLEASWVHRPGSANVRALNAARRHWAPWLEFGLANPNGLFLPFPCGKECTFRAHKASLPTSENYFTLRSL